MKGHLLGREPVIGDPARRGDASGRITRTFAFQEVSVRGVGEVVKFLRLPGLQALGKAGDVLAIARWRNLFRESSSASSPVECFATDDSSRLMIAVVFAGHITAE